MMRQILSGMLASISFMPLSAQQLMPRMNAHNVCVDTHLCLTFDSDVKVGTKGMVRIYDVTDGRHDCIDSLDMSIPAGPTESREYGPDCDYTKVPYNYYRTFMPTNRNTVPGTPSGTAERTPQCYQLNIIGGFTDAFHFYPVIVHGRTATIYPHNNMLEYGHSYEVNIDRDVLSCADGFSGISSWTFTTKRKAPKGTTLKVNGNGKADFCTVQGAFDAIPDFSTTPYIIKVAAGDYEELVYTRNKHNVTIAGAGMDKTNVHYANNEVFNPHPMTVKTNEWPGTFPSRRAAFDVDNCRNITFRDISIATDYKGQAEGLLINGEHISLYKVHITGSGDAIQANGTVYMEECELDGEADSFLSRGSLFAYRCNLRNDGGPFTWCRSTKGHHGLVFVECSFSTNNGRPVDFGRCPTNKKTNYPDAEMVLINCRTATTIPEGWSAIGEPTAKYWEYNTTDITTGKPVCTAHRHDYSRQLTKEEDAETIRNYSSPEWVLGGKNEE